MSDVPEGYMMSEVGVIPVDWDVKTLGEKATKIGSGITPTGGEKVYKSEGRPFLRSQNVGWGNLILEDIAFIDDKIHNTFKATEIEKNDVFLNITGASIGRSAIADERVQNGNVNQHVCIIRTIDDELNPKFLNYFLLSKKGQKQIDSFQAGGNRQGLNFGQIKSFQIPLPPLPEQKAIASALSDVDALITALEQLITKKRNIKKGAMQQLLAGKKRLPGFSGVWDVKTFGEIFKFLSTGSNSRSDLSDHGEVKYIHYGDIHTKWKYFLDFSKDNIPSIIKDKVENLPLLKDGDLVMADASEDYEGLGISVEVKNIKNEKVVAGLHTLLLRGDKKLVADGFKGYIQSIKGVQNSLKRIATGISVYGISKSNLMPIQIHLPPLPEQQAIAQILSDMDTEIESLEQKRDKYKAIKQGMMQELLTGKMRLVKEDKV